MLLAKVSSNGLGWRDFLSSLFISFVKNRHRQLVNHSTCGHGRRRSHRSHRHPGWLRRGRGVPEDHGACHGPGGLLVALAAAGADVAAGMPKTVVVRELVWQVENLAISVGVQPSLLAWFPVPLALTCRESGK